MINENKIKMVNIQQIAEKGAEIYSKIKGQYEPKENGRFLAIDVYNGDVFFGVTSVEAVEKARESHPNQVFYVVKIGFSAAETLARLAMSHL